MYKIKKSVDSKELEKNGFEWVEEFDAHVRNCEYNYEGVSYADILCIRKNEVKLYVDIPRNNVDLVLEQITKDLIKANLVDVV
jgi:hypothetical protein